MIWLCRAASLRPHHGDWLQKPDGHAFAYVCFSGSTFSPLACAPPRTKAGRAIIYPESDGAINFKNAVLSAARASVSKRLGSPYRSGRVDHWLKIKNPAASAVRREAEADWEADGRGRRR